jgi:hypothetical protein
MVIIINTSKVSCVLCIVCTIAVYHREFKQRAVKGGDKLDLGGGHVMEFVMAPNLHWPDTMFSFDHGTGATPIVLSILTCACGRLSHTQTIHANLTCVLGGVWLVCKLWGVAVVAVDDSRATHHYPASQ